MYPAPLVSGLEHKGKLERPIKLSKCEPYTYGALEELSHRGLKYALSLGYYLFDYVVVPVPLSNKKQKKRGFNQASLIGKVVAFYLGLSFESTLLSRGDKLRFSVSPKKLGKKKILLVDDVSISGNTLRECSQVLYAAGATEVRCFTLSRCYNAPGTFGGLAER